MNVSVERAAEILGIAPQTLRVDASYDIDAFKNESLFGELKYERKKK